jgi:splicing factor 3A subunit 2
VFRNHVGQFECRLCLTVHRTLPDYVAHTQGRKHQEGLRRRAAEERAKAGVEGLGPAAEVAGGAAAASARRRKRITIGKPGYVVTKERDPRTGQLAVLFELSFPEIDAGTQPRHRFVSAYEQRTETPDPAFQYLVFAADPYETVAFKLSSLAVDRGDDKVFSHWDAARKVFTLQVFFRSREEMRAESKRRQEAAAASVAAHSHAHAPRAIGRDGRAIE